MSAPDPGRGTTVRFDHTGWRDTDQMFRVVTFGWGQMLGRLKGFADTGRPLPCFDF